MKGEIGSDIISHVSNKQFQFTAFTYNSTIATEALFWKIVRAVLLFLICLSTLINVNSATSIIKRGYTNE